jgi:hypothetical protein
MTKQDLHDYNKWLTEVWSKQHSNIPFMKDAPNAYLKYRTKQLTLTDVVEPFYCDVIVGEEGYRCKKQCDMCKEFPK